MIDVADQQVIAVQMGRGARGVVSVAARCPEGHPSVVTCYPLRRKGEHVVPFPTLYWLTCPRLNKMVANLEREGAIAAIAEVLANDVVMQARLLQDHQDYIARRWATLSAADRELVSRRGLLHDFTTRGIGGMANHAAVKCLHLHLAHHLVCGNVIGDLFVRKYDVRPCVAR